MEHEIERMVIRLLGDGSSYQNMLSKAQTQTGAASTAISKGADQSGKSWAQSFGVSKDGLESFVAGVGSLLGGITLSGFISEAKEAYTQQVQSERQLGAMLQVSGRNVDGLMERYKAFASEMQRQTGTADENVLSMVRQAETMGASGDQAERAVKNYLAAEAAGIPLRGGLRALIALEQGHSKMLASTFPELRGITDESERTARAQQLLGNAFEIARLEGERGSTKLRVAWNELMEDFGKTVFEMSKPIVEIKLLFVEWLASLSPFTKQVIVIFAMLTASALTFWGTMILGAKVFNMMTGGLLLIVGLAVVAAVAIAAWAYQLGGIQQLWNKVKNTAVYAWGYIKAAAAAFWSWISPVVLTVGNTLASVWDKAVAWASLAWENIKQRVLGFWQWARPIVIAGMFFFRTAWDYAVLGASIAWDFITARVSEAWTFITGLGSSLGQWFNKMFSGGDSAGFFDKFRWAVVAAFVTAEFFVTHFWRIWDVAMAFAKFKLVEWYESARNVFAGLVGTVFGVGNVIREVFSIAWTNMRVLFETSLQSILRGIASMLDSFGHLMTGVTSFISGMLDRLAAIASLDPTGALAAGIGTARNALTAAGGFRNDMVASIRGMADALAPGELILGDIGQRVGDSFTQGINSGFAAAGGQIGGSQLLQRLRTEYNQAAGILGEDFEAFLARRMAEIQGFQFPGLGQQAGEAARQQEQYNQQLGQTADKAAKLKDITAVGFFSADALARVAEQMDMINQRPQAGRGRDATDANSAMGIALQQEANGYLSQIANREPVEFAEAGIA